MLRTIVSILAFFAARKKFWLLPILLFLLMFASMFVLTQGTVVAPFVYTVF